MLLLLLIVLSVGMALPLADGFIVLMMLIMYDLNPRTSIAIGSIIAVIAAILNISTMTHYYGDDGFVLIVKIITAINLLVVGISTLLILIAHATQRSRHQQAEAEA